MRCTRCGGLVVAEHFNGGETMIDGWAYQGLRCVNCGAIMADPGFPLMNAVGPLPVLRRGAEGAS